MGSSLEWGFVCDLMACWEPGARRPKSFEWNEPNYWGFVGLGVPWGDFVRFFNLKIKFEFLTIDNEFIFFSSIF